MLSEESCTGELGGQHLRGPNSLTRRQAHENSIRAPRHLSSGMNGYVSDGEAESQLPP